MARPSGACAACGFTAFARSQQISDTGGSSISIYPESRSFLFFPLATQPTAVRRQRAENQSGLEPRDRAGSHRDAGSVRSHDRTCLPYARLLPRARAGIADLLPTLLELARLPPVTHADGRSMVPLLRGGATEAALREEFEERPILAHRIEWGGERQLWSVIGGRWKLISSAGKSSSDALYDLVTDPAERRDRSAEHRDVVEALRSALADFRAKSGPGTPLQVELDAADEVILRELGYVE